MALYPTALAHLVLPFFAAFNLHLWLHLLLAPFALLWLARELGLDRRAAWVAAVTWGVSGFVISQLAFYNLVAGVALAPALAAAAVRAARRRREGEPAAGALAATAVLWALELVAGDPQTALAAGLAAAGLALAELPWRRRTAAAGRGGVFATIALLAAAVAAGTLLALPQLAELLAILPASARGAGYAAAMRGAGSLDPRQALGWLLPFPYGRPDLVGPGGFWGYRFHQGSWPFYFTLYPGLAALGLIAASGRSWRLAGALGRVGRRGWALVAAGLFCALGAFNPVVAALLALPGADLTRYPLKWWLWGAMGAALLAGVGWQRIERRPCGDGWRDRRTEPERQRGGRRGGDGRRGGRDGAEDDDRRRARRRATLACWRSRSSSSPAGCCCACGPAAPAFSTAGCRRGRRRRWRWRNGAALAGAPRHLGRHRPAVRGDAFRSPAAGPASPGRSSSPSTPRCSSPCWRRRWPPSRWRRTARRRRSSPPCHLARSSPTARSTASSAAAPWRAATCRRRRCAGSSAAASSRPTRSPARCTVGATTSTPRRSGSTRRSCAWRRRR